MGGKPAIIVTYGGHGGDKCAAQLRQVCDGLKIMAVPTMPALTVPRATIEANNGEIDPADAFAGSIDTVRAAFGELLTAGSDAPPV